MVKELPRKCVPEVCANIWPLAQDPAHQFYPLFESEEDVRDTLSWTMEDDDARVYGYWRGRVLEGVCCLFIAEERHYVLIIALYAWGNFRVAANAFLRRIEEEFSGYTIEAGIAGEHTRFAAKLIRSGFVLQDNRFDLRRPLTALDTQELPILEELSILEGEALGAYAALHDAWFPDCGWSVEDLEHCQENWLIVTAQRGGAITGAIFVYFGAQLAGVLGFHAEDERMARALLLAALRQSTKRSDLYGEIRWMAQQNDPFLSVAYDLGFVQTAHYTFYRRKTCD